MRWMNFVAAALLAALPAANCLAEMPDFSGNQPQAMSLMRGRLLGGQGWWTRYGEPVNAAALEQPVQADKSMPAGPMPMYGDGYAYAPGACDCSPPCIWGLWAGYFQNPKRCHPHHLRHCGCGNGCNDCGDGCGHSCFLTRIFGHHCCGNSCTSAVGCGCTTPVSCAAPSCSTAVSDCGCKPVCGKCRHCHLGSRFLAHWNCGCNSCSSPIGCGCATPAAPAPTPEKQAFDGPPTPLPEAALFPLPRLN